MWDATGCPGNCRTSSGKLAASAIAVLALLLWLVSRHPAGRRLTAAIPCLSLPSSPADPSQVPTHYGSTLYFWSFKDHTLKQKVCAYD